MSTDRIGFEAPVADVTQRNSPRDRPGPPGPKRVAVGDWHQAHDGATLSGRRARRVYTRETLDTILH
jgi:hypothetical protein